MEFLKENAEYFEKKAVEALSEKPRFVLFFAEQALQLYVKYILAKVNDNAKRFYEENADVFDLLEEAYITARYLGKEYSKKSAERALNLLKKFKEEFKEWLT